MRKLVALALLAGLVFGSVGVAEAAKKKKKKKKAPVASELKYFLHWDSDGATPEGCTGPVHMNLQDATGDSTCNYTFQPLQEAFIATGAQAPLVYTYPATEGVPFVVDASRKLKGEIVLRGTFTIQGKVDLVLNATIGGQQVKLAEGSTAAANGVLSSAVQGQQMPGPPAVLPVDLEINKAADKQQVTALSLDVVVRGLHRGGIDYEATPSHVIVPAFV